MSGGIDSSVAAGLLKQANFNVKGLFLKLYNSASFRNSQKEARKIAEVLGIPFLVLDLRREFKQKVIDYFLKEYKRGRTPNPCVVCNREIKFGILLKEVLDLGADYLATGHYARLRQEILNPLDRAELTTPRRVASEIRNYKLFRGKDKEKDQSYFLWQLNQKQLRYVLFPLGDYKKSEVIEIAKKFKIFKLVKKESRDVCFIKNTVEEFLSPYLKQKFGKIINSEGKVIGKHQGLWFYTIGQRRGIGVSGGPYYVSGKDFKKNLLIVTKNRNHLYKKSLICEKVNWISGKEPNIPFKIKAKIRYRHQPASAIAKKLKPNIYKLTFKKPQRAITPGQSVVFYKREEVLGGGIIC